jgi:DAK2 domain fusion protein YloV
MSAYHITFGVVLECLDAAAVRHWCAVSLDALRRHRGEIDELNVYPVPDGDTGTNLVLTVESAYEALATEPDVEDEIARLGRVLHCMARGAVLGARGNSGVIISQLLRGTADALAGTPLARGRALADALAAAAKAGYAAVAEPVEGTVLTVASAAAFAAASADTDDLVTVVRAAAGAAAHALARTPEQLPALARAGVVDAGGRGLVILLEALVEVVTGEAVAMAPLARVARDPNLLTVVREVGSDAYAYEVQYLLEAGEDDVAGLKRVLAGLGDSLVVVGTGTGGQTPTWNVHVHVNDVGAAIEAGVAAGRPHRISVTRFADQTRPSTVDGPDPEQAEPVAVLVHESATGIVAISAGAGLTTLFTREGAVVVDALPGSAPSTGEILAAIRGAGTGRVAVLPNDSDVHPAAQLAAAEARAEGIEVGVVPTRSSVQALAALAVRDPQRRFQDEIIAMSAAAGACRWAGVTFATRTALTVAGRCEPGDVLALVEGEVNLIGRDLAETCAGLLDRMLAGGGELVTLVLGADAPAELGEQLTAHLRRSWTFVEAQLYAGGQPSYPLLVGVE